MSEDVLEVVGLLGVLKQKDRCWLVGKAMAGQRERESVGTTVVHFLSINEWIILTCLQNRKMKKITVAVTDFPFQ